MEEVQGTAGEEGFGDGVAEVCGGGGEGGALVEVDDLFAVGRDDHGVEVVLVGDGGAEGSERELAAAAEGVQDGAFGGDGVLRCGAVEGADGGVDGGVAGILGG